MAEPLSVTRIGLLRYQGEADDDLGSLGVHDPVLQVEETGFGRPESRTRQTCLGDVEAATSAFQRSSQPKPSQVSFQLSFQRAAVRWLNNHELSMAVGQTGVRDLGLK